MKYLLVFSIIGFAFTLQAQFSQKEIDKMCEQYCHELERAKVVEDTSKYDEVTHAFFTSKLEIINQRYNSQQDLNAFVDRFYLRMQKKCSYFREYLRLIETRPKTDEWMLISQKPKSTLSDQELTTFKNTVNFFYIESHDQTKTKLTIKDGYWKEDLSDGTYSLLKIKWKEKGKFQLEFIESTNIAKQGISTAGDTFNYQILSKEADYYWVVALISKKEMVKFKLHVE